MSLSPFALDSHVDEALRLFQVSTLDAALSGSLSGAEGFTSNDDQEEVRKIERQLKNRFPIGSNVSEQRIIQDFLKQVHTHTHTCPHNHWSVCPCVFWQNYSHTHNHWPVYPCNLAELF